MDKETKREIILDNYQNPTNRGLVEDESYKKANTRSSSCIDNIDLMMKIEDGKVYRNGKKVEEYYLAKGIETNGKTFSDITVPENCVFVMGDNREASTDSRDFGCIPINKIESRVAFRFWPLNKFGKID